MPINICGFNFCKCPKLLVLKKNDFQADKKNLKGVTKKKMQISVDDLPQL